MSDREDDLAPWIRDWRFTACNHSEMRADEELICCSPCLRDRFLASDWLATHDADILAPLREFLNRPPTLDKLGGDYSHEEHWTAIAILYGTIRELIDTDAQADGGGTTPDFDPTDNGSVACPTRDCIADRGHRGPCLIKPDHDAVQRENLRAQADGADHESYEAGREDCRR